MNKILGNKVVLAIAGIAIGLICMLTEKEAEFNWAYAILASIFMFGLAECFNMVSSEKKFNWKNPVVALSGTVVAVILCLLL